MDGQLTEEEQQHAMRIITEYARLHGNGATEQAKRAAVLSVYAALGGGCPIAPDYGMIEQGEHEGVEWITENDPDSFTVLAENPLGLPVGVTYVTYNALVEGLPEDFELLEENTPTDLTPEYLDSLTRDQLYSAAIHEGIKVPNNALKADIRGLLDEFASQFGEEPTAE